jgi:sulfhydrogenase subunit delta
MSQATAKPTVGIFGLTGCAGDQLAILNCEDELLELVDVLDVRDFLMASSDNDEESRLDIALVEGAVLSARDEAKVKRIRERADTVVALGTCALHGGVPIMDRDHDRDALLRQVYGELGTTYDSAPARALHEVIDVDLGIPGCPIEKDEFLGAIAHLLAGDPPLGREYPVCAECKMDENDCVLISPDAFCMGPVTAAGCGARCPALRVGCVGCRGPAVDANAPALVAAYEERGMPRDVIERKMRTFAAVATGGRES